MWQAVESVQATHPHSKISKSSSTHLNMTVVNAIRGFLPISAYGTSLTRCTTYTAIFGKGPKRGKSAFGFASPESSVNAYPSQGTGSRAQDGRDGTVQGRDAEIGTCGRTQFAHAPDSAPPRVVSSWKRFATPRSSSNTFVSRDLGIGDVQGSLNSAAWNSAVRKSCLSFGSE